MNVDKTKIKVATEMLLEALGEDLSREGLKDTPMRVANAWEEFLQPDEKLNTTFQEIKVNSMIMVRGITGWSFCEHHIIPFSYVATVGYIPKEKVLGLSKIPRVVRHEGRRLRTQETMTRDIIDHLKNLTETEDIAVRLEGVHLCMVMRGVKAQGASMVTQELSGAFMDDGVVRNEFMMMADSHGLLLQP